MNPDDLVIASQKSRFVRIHLLLFFPFNVYMRLYTNLIVYASFLHANKASTIMMNQVITEYAERLRAASRRADMERGIA